jgi:hypothetical protein
LRSGNSLFARFACRTGPAFVAAALADSIVSGTQLISPTI